MRFLITATPDPDAPKTEASFDDAKMAEYMALNEEMHRAGVLVASEGLHPAGRRARVGRRGDRRVVLDGPFAESKELVGGFYLIDVASFDEALAWALRCPTGFGSDDILTVLPMTNAEDLPPEVLDLIRRAAPTWAAAWSKS